jgi:hypothetical protein
MAGWKAGAVAVLAGVVLGAAAAPAGASGGLVIDVEGGGPIFQTDSVYPGFETSTTVHVRNDGSGPAVLTLRSASIIDEDHCSPAELRAEMPCGSGKGDLGEQMELSVDVLTADGYQPVWSGSVYELEQGEVLADPLDADGSTATFRFGAHLPTWSGNETQMDVLGFDLRFDLEGRGSAEVAGMVLGRPSGTSGVSVLGLELPVTGRGAAAAAAGAALLVSSGAVLLRGTRQLGIS